MPSYGGPLQPARDYLTQRTNIPRDDAKPYHFSAYFFLLLFSLYLRDGAKTRNGLVRYQ